MKLVLGAAVMILLVGAPSYARQEPDKDKPQAEPKRQEEPKKGEEPNKGRQEQPADKSKQEPDRQQPQDRAKPAQQNDRTQQQQQDDRNRNQGIKPAQQNERTQQQAERNRNEQSKPAQQQDRPQDQQRAQQTGQHNDRANANERGGTRRVPDDQFRASFGSSHHFHVQRGDRRFNYGGYYFQYTEAWPSDWDYNDDVYIDYIDGNYYLINPRRPGVRLLVVIVD